MVPASDDNTDANKPEESTSEQRTLLDRLKFWKRCKQEAKEPARLTHMPACLMHWWTPLLVAFILFSLSFICAWGWGWQWHLPSSNAMKLCMTITGAGLAFSAWQQRSHDNATSAKQARAAIERDDYWKRREHIFRTLGSSNPRIRLGAIAMLTELADSAEFSEHLNNTEKQLLQRHIIDTLCLQMKYEGHAQKSEGSKEERSKIQLTITTAILQRINQTNRQPKLANWSYANIDFTQAKILTSITIDNIQTSTHLDFQHCTFTEDLIITDSTLDNITWRNARFRKSISCQGKNVECIISANELPSTTEACSFINTIFISSPRSTFDLNKVAENTHSSITLDKCKFYSKNCTCPPECKCKISSTPEQCNCFKNKHCTCETRCIHSNITIFTTTLYKHNSCNTCHTCQFPNAARVRLKLSSQSTITGLELSETTFRSKFLLYTREYLLQLTPKRTPPRKSLSQVTRYTHNISQTPFT